MKLKPNSIVVLVDNCWGQYAWQRLAQSYPISGLSKAEIDILKSGPDAEWYDDVVEKTNLFRVTVEIDNNVYCVEANDNGDLLGIPSHWEFDDTTDTWGEPESDTLRRYTLPSHWACQLANGDGTGLTDEEQKEIVAFLESENLTNWTFADVSERQWFTWHPDSGGLACDVSRFTFVRIP